MAEEKMNGLYDERLFRINPDSVIVLPDRTRKEFDPEKLRELADSIRRRKQDTPGICRHDDNGRCILVAGERRLRACELAGAEFTYRLEESVDEVEIREIEIEENICRVNLTWLEEANAIAELHKLKQEKYGETSPGKAGGWGEKNTAEFLERSLGGVHEDIQLSTFASQIPEVANARTKTDAKKMIKRLTKNLERSQALREAEKKAAVEGGLENATTIEQKLAYYANKIHLGKMEDVLPTLKGTYDVVIWDPPWGVDFDKNMKEVASQRKYEDDKDFFVENFPLWLKLIWDKMSEDSHLYLFFGIRNYTYVYDRIEETGFKTSRIPIIWYKQGVHRTRNPDIEPGRSYEPIAYCRKGNKKLSRLGAPDHIITPGASPALKQSHPSGKHPDVYRDLLSRSASPGDRCLDPMAGSGMMGVAADILEMTHRLDWDEIEVIEDYRNLAISNSARGYFDLIKEGEARKGEGE